MMRTVTETNKGGRYFLTAEDLDLLNAALNEYSEIEIQKTPDNGFRIIGKKTKVKTLLRRPEKK